MRSILKIAFIKPGRLFCMDTYLWISRPFLQHLSSLQNHQKVWKTKPWCATVFFSLPLHNTENKNAFKEKESSLKTVDPVLPVLSEGYFGFCCAGSSPVAVLMGRIVLLSEVLKPEGCQGVLEIPTYPPVCLVSLLHKSKLHPQWFECGKTVVHVGVFDEGFKWQSVVAIGLLVNVFKKGRV